MLIQFQIEYKTFFGQQLMLTGSHPELGGDDREKAVPMRYREHSEGIWTYNMVTGGDEAFRYRYFLRDNNFHTETGEWGDDREFDPGEGSSESVLLMDHWRSMGDPACALLTSAFTSAIFRPEKRIPMPEIKRPQIKNGIQLVFKPTVSRIKADHRVAVIGNAEVLGSWNEKKAVLLGNSGFPHWMGEVQVAAGDFPVRYKYLVQDETGETLFWEKSPDHVIELADGVLPSRIEIRDEMFDFPQTPWKGTGLAIPVFSLRRKNGWGVGEFSDLKLLADWAVETGIQMIQVLPVNDTVARHTWQDSYPYAAISVYALHPVYINLSEIGRLDSETTGRIMEEQGRFLNHLDKMDYEAVMSLKSRYFKLIYDQQKEKFLSDPEFISFFERNQSWLKAYAAFSYLRDLFNTPDFYRWNEYAVFSPEVLEKLTDPSSTQYDDIAIHYFIQYHAHRQLSNAAAYAREKGIALKGDLPIGIFRNSVDAWVNPELFHMDSQAGAPPDDFSATGQNWRFPTYNWEVMARDNYAWWQQRLRHMSVYFDAFRIDHILGFFRIWEIPETQVQGLMGTFNPSIPFSRNEILSKGVYFDENRFCKPYIREHFLSLLFGEDTEYVKNNFLTEYAPGCYQLVEELDTQHKVEVRFTPAEGEGAEERNRRERIREGLYLLIAEIIFIEKKETGGNRYYPRNSFHSTWSFRDLDTDTRQKLDEIYIDYFYRRNEDFWRSKALTKLPAIKSATNMLLCGEDLGMVPACVPSVMNELGILGLEVQRMPKDPRVEFGNPANYPYLSVATPSSHDTSTLRGWWEENREGIRKFYNHLLGNQGEAPETCTPDIVRQIIFQHLGSPSMWAVFPVQDLLGMDEQLRLPDPSAERINEPGNPNHYWRYRLHLNLEDLLLQKEFNAGLRKMIEESGRLRVY